MFLYLVKCNVTEIVSKQFHPMEKLTYLDLSDNQLERLDLSTQHDFPSLEIINLGKNKFDKAAIWEIFQKYPNLAVVDEPVDSHYYWDI